MNMLQIAFIVAGSVFSLVGILLLTENISKESTIPAKDNVVSHPLSELKLPVETAPQVQDNYQVGRDFEQFVMQKLIAKKGQFKVLNQRHDQIGPDGRPLPDNHNPDLEVVAFWNNKKEEFAIECKFRFHWNADNSIEWCKEYNLTNYREFSKKRNMSVFIVLGIGGAPSSPLEMFCFKLTEHTTTRVLRSVMHTLPEPQQPGFFYYFPREELQFRGYPA